MRLAPRSLQRLSLFIPLALSLSISFHFSTFHLVNAAPPASSALHAVHMPRCRCCCCYCCSHDGQHVMLKKECITLSLRSSTKAGTHAGGEQQEGMEDGG